MKLWHLARWRCRQFGHHLSLVSVIEIGQTLDWVEKRLVRECTRCGYVVANRIETPVDQDDDGTLETPWEDDKLKRDNVLTSKMLQKHQL